MLRFRPIVVLTLLTLWMAVPALSCLPHSHMTAAEMACCKKMAGNCNMGAGQHPCCKTVSRTPTSVASIAPIVQIHTGFALVANIAIVERPSVSTNESRQLGLGLPPPAPPGLNPTLRI